MGSEMCIRDRYYDGISFAPDIFVNFQSSYDADWPSGLILDEVFVSKSDPVIDPAVDVVRDVKYSYATDNNATEIPRLAGISDSRKNSSGAE